MGNPTVVSLKLLINTQTKQVLFAEAGKDFVDFLFCILSLPVAKVISLVLKQGMVGSLSNLYESVENLNKTYIQPKQDKNTLLKPAISQAATDSCLPLLHIIEAPAPNKFYYRCGFCQKVYSYEDHATCPDCIHKMTRAAEQQASGEGGFVKGVVTYMVMDDLVVTPMSTISSITMLNKFNVKEVGDLEEKVVDFGVNEAVKLLKASLETKNVLTSVFM